MKQLLALSVVVAAMAFTSGCQDTPGYSASERFNQIGRNFYYNQSQMNDDIDHALLLRPASRLTIWNIYHRE